MVQGLENNCGEKEEGDGIGMYREMGQENSADLLDKLEGSGKAQRKMVLAEVERQ